MAWLNRHDRECGDLYGILPLIEGLPVAFTDHVDRSPDKQFFEERLRKYIPGKQVLQMRVCGMMMHAFCKSFQKSFMLNSKIARGSCRERQRKVFIH